MRIRLRYFAKLQEQAGCAEEWLDTTAATPRDVWPELAVRHGFSLESRHLMVAMNDDFSGWDVPLIEGATLVFIPPVAGG